MQLGGRGMKNGRAHDDEEPRDPKISRIEEERRRRQRGEGMKPGSGGAKPRPLAGKGLKEWLVGAVLVAMAIGFVASLIAPLVR